MRLPMCGIESYCLGVRHNSFHQPQFDPNSSWVDFFEKVFINVNWNDIKVGNNFIRHTQFGPKAPQTISQRRFLPKLKVCPSSVSSTNLSAQNSKLENNALDNTSLLLMYRRYNLLFYSQFSCAIARFLFSNISVSFRLAFSMYFLSSGDGLNNLSMSIGSTRYSPDSVRTRDNNIFPVLSIVASHPVGHDDTTITSFDIPCNLCPVVASLIFAGICII